MSIDPWIAADRRLSVSISYIRNSMFSLALIALPVLGSAQMPQLRAVPEEEPVIQLQALKDGGYHVQASIRINAPRERVWDVLKDCGQALRYVPGMRACEVLESNQYFDIARHKVRRSVILPSLDYQFRSDYFPYERIVVHLLEGDLRRLEGEWLFASCGERCAILSYNFNVEARWYVPTSAERHALRDDVPEMLRRLKAQAEEAL